MTIQTNYRVAAYCRLSRDDGTNNESISIATQKEMLSSYIQDKGWTLVDFYVDDGFSGMNFERPSFKRMIQDIEIGKIDCVITKDLSRLGRSYLDCGYYQEIYFPEHRVRYIAINDGVDTQNMSTMDITPFRNIINEMYAKDTSVKIKSALHAQFKSGKFHGTTPPYGYKKDPADHNHLIVDQAVAPVVREIFNMALQGKGVRIIRNALRKQQILRPSAYAAVRGDYMYEHLQTSPEKRYSWTENGVRMILRNPTYAGNLCGYRRISLGIKSNKRLCILPENWEVVPNTHEGIVSQAVFNQVQCMMDIRRGKKDTLKIENLFLGMLRCGDCGQILRLTKAHRRKQVNPLNNYQYVCNNYMQYGLENCTMHKLEAAEIYDVVLQEINLLAAMAVKDPEFVTKIRKQSAATAQQRKNALKAEQKRLQKRISELDALFADLYEDKVMGRIPARSYNMISEKYMTEQNGLEKEIEQVENTLKQLEDEEKTALDFAEQISVFAGFTELTRSLLELLIDHIDVFESQLDDTGHEVQVIRICYKMVGVLEDTSFQPAPIKWDYAPIACKTCHQEFLPHGNRAIYCPACAAKRKKASEAESKKRSRERYRQTALQGHPFQQKICPVCKKAFWPEKSGRQVYCCSECKKNRTKING